jgi:hypothetical protein
VQGQRCADHLQVNRPLWDHVAHDTHTHHLRVRRWLLEVVSTQPHEMVDARHGARPDHLGLPRPSPTAAPDGREVKWK